MNKVAKYMFIALIVLLCGSWSMPNVTNCNDIVKKYFEQSRKLVRPEGNKTYYMEAEMTTINRPTTRLPDVNVRMKFLINSRNFQYESNQVSIYEDRIYNYTVIHHKKMVIKNRVTGDRAKAQQLGNFIGMQDAMIEYANSSICSSIKTNQGENIIEIKLVINREGQEYLKAKEIILLIEKDTYVIRKSIINYVDSHPMYSQTVEFNKVDYDFKDGKPLSPEDVLFTLNGKFRKKYSGYSLVDNSQNKIKK